MRRDLCFYYPCPMNTLFGAFLQAAKQQFGKDCRILDGKSINFGLNYSFKYNMNGGSITVHFMPYQNGTAVDLRYSVVQLMGARYKKHAEDLTGYVSKLIGIKAQPANIDINLFLQYEGGAKPIAPAKTAPQAPVVPQPAAAPVQPVRQAAPQPQQGTRRFCIYCGKQLPANARFCPECGGKVN